MRRTRSIALTCVFVAAAAIAAAQPGQRRGGPPPGGPGGGPVARGGPQTLEFAQIEAAMGPIVRGAPYSGEGVTTTTQTLADGTRIERTVRARFYRDGEGRTRREQTILGLPELGGDSQTITIVDPVARVSYVLNAAKREARRNPLPAFAPNGAGRPADAPPPPPPPPAAYGDDPAAGVPPPPPPPPPPPGAPGARGTGPRGGGAGRGVARGGPAVANMPEPLGTRQIEGVTANGTKRTEVLPTGRIGNDRPIEITDERWDSPELKVLLLSKHHDPRTGDFEYRLTNIVRAEPPRELFMPPGDYTIVDPPPPPPSRR